LPKLSAEIENNFDFYFSKYPLSNSKKNRAPR